MNIFTKDELNALVVSVKEHRRQLESTITILAGEDLSGYKQNVCFLEQLENKCKKSNCVEVILFYGHKGELVEKMAETCKCEQSLASEFINKYFHFLTEDGGVITPLPQPE